MKGRHCVDTALSTYSEGDVSDAFADPAAFLPLFPLLLNRIAQITDFTTVRGAEDQRCVSAAQSGQMNAGSRNVEKTGWFIISVIFRLCSICIFMGNRLRLTFQLLCRRVGKTGGRHFDLHQPPPEFLADIEGNVQLKDISSSWDGF